MKTTIKVLVLLAVAAVIGNAKAQNCNVYPELIKYSPFGIFVEGVSYPEYEYTDLPLINTPYFKTDRMNNFRVGLEYVFYRAGHLSFVVAPSLCFYSKLTSLSEDSGGNCDVTTSKKVGLNFMAAARYQYKMNFISDNLYIHALCGMQTGGAVGLGGKIDMQYDDIQMQGLNVSSSYCSMILSLGLSYAFDFMLCDIDFTYNVSDKDINELSYSYLGVQQPSLIQKANYFALSLKIHPKKIFKAKWI